MRPSRPSPTVTRNGAPVASTRVPGPIPCSSPRGISSVRPSRKPTTSAATAARLRSVPTRQTSPTSACSPVASMIRPIRLLTKPWRRARSASRIASRGALQQSPGGALTGSCRGSPAPSSARIDLARTLELRLRRWRRSRPRRVRTSAPPRARAGRAADPRARSRCACALQIAERAPARSRGRRG